MSANDCEGCAHCKYPGVRWPASPDGDSTFSYVERCDYCERYDGDLSAALHLAADKGVGVGIARRCVYEDDEEFGIEFGPTTDPVAIRKAWRESSAGTSLFIDHPERDE